MFRYRVFLSSVFPSELRSRLSTILGLQKGALHARQLPRQQLRSAQMMVFSHFSPKEKKCDNQARVECEPGVALELMAIRSLCRAGGGSRG